MTNGPSSLSRTAISVTTSTTTFSRLLEPFTGAWPVWTTSRDQRSQARSKRKTSALLLTVRFVRGSGGAPRSYAPTFVAGNCRNRAMRRYLPFATISAEDVACPKSICEWAKSGQGRQPVLRARKPHARLLHCNHGLCGEWRIERFWLRSINRGNRLLAASGFKYVGVTGVLTYVRKPGGGVSASCAYVSPLRCDTLPEVFPLNGCRPPVLRVLSCRSPAALSQGGF